MIRSKECFKCKTVKPLTEFYKHSMMADGHLNKCKDCAKKDVGEHRAKNIEKIREYDRKRSKQRDRISAAAQFSKKWRKEDNRRQSAHNKVARAIKAGTLIKVPCERCGEAKSVAHHDDYDKPLSVIWLCQPCHSKRHKELKEAILRRHS